METTEWIEIFISVDQSALEAIAGVCYECGLTGLMIHDSEEFEDFLQCPERDWDYIADELVDEQKEMPTGITVFLRDNIYGLDQLSQIKSALATVKTLDLPFALGSLELTVKNIKEEDWANNWKKYFKPFPVGDKIMIKPSWEELTAPTDKIILNIDPAHVFGTGTHETTQLCLELVETHVETGDTLLDIGCGSGILSIAGLLLGASHAEAVDIDPNSIAISYANSDRNAIPREKYTVKSGNILEDESLSTEYKNRNFDVVVANIVADVIIALTSKVPNFIKKDGIFLCSGIITQREEDVISALESANFQILEIKRKKDWVAIATKYTGTEGKTHA
ncbi:MAG: 50S ribosomal protein L11 methyltransferase [Bacillota bacterium]